MESRNTAVQPLLGDIRQCTDCDIANRNTPVVYSAPRPKIMVVSEIPLKRAWANGLGREWEKSLGLQETKTGTTYQFCRSLDIVDEADRLLFWIQRANCSVDAQRGDVFRHCSDKFIPRAIEAVRPKLVITLGHSAARYFQEFRHISEVVGGAYPRREGSVEYTWVPLFHPSNANQATRKKFKTQHENSIAAAKIIIEQIKHDAKPE